MNNYSAAVPKDGGVRPEIVQFYERFYAVSDTPSAHEEYADMFTKEASLIIASSSATGHDDIVKFRHGMWEKVAKRSHKLFKIYPFGAGSDEVMLYGEVEYESKTGDKTLSEWAARARFSQEDGKLKMNFYQVYLDRSGATRI